MSVLTFYQNPGRTEQTKKYSLFAHYLSLTNRNSRPGKNGSGLSRSSISTVYGGERRLQFFDGRADGQQLFIGVGATGQLQPNRQTGSIEATVQA